jgi:serine/threonine-protein kinase
MAMTRVGRYEILETIGQGAMGAVYKARDPLMDRVVALKTILGAVLTGPEAAEFRERFFREARAAGRLSHPGIVTVYDVGEQDGTPFLVMEYIGGRTLESALDSGERFPQPRICELGEQLADALHYAHESGVIHRDIKPANILLTGKPERAKIADFGVAKLISVQMTATGRLLGTPSFMAPEQFTGAPIDGRSDLFSLGVILYWMATGDKPFTGETITAVSYKIVHTDPIAPRMLNPAIPREFEAVLLKCLEKDPAVRYQNGGQLARDLRGIREGRRVSRAIPAVVPVPAGTVLDEALPRAGKNAPTQAGVSRPSSPGGQASRATAGLAVPQRSAPVATPPATTSFSQSKVTEPPERHKSVVPLLVFGLLALLAAGGVIKRFLANQNRSTSLEPAAPVAAATPAAQAPLAPAPAPGPVTAPAPAVPAAKEDTEASSSDSSSKAKELAPAAKEVNKELSDATPERSEKPAPPPPSHPKAHALQLDVSAVASANLEIQSDDQPIVTRQMVPGNTLRAAADRAFWLRTDSAGALEMKLNGYDLPKLGPIGSPRSLRITPHELAILQAGEASEMPQGKPNPPAEVAHAHLFIEVNHIPHAVNLAIWMDGRLLLERPPTAQPGGGAVYDEKDVPPGTHHFRVTASRPWIQGALEDQASGEFQAGLGRTLRIVLRRARQLEEGAAQLSVTLE